MLGVMLNLNTKRGKKGENKVAVSIKPSPVFKGKAAEKLIRQIENPTSKKELLAKCIEMSKIFKEE